MLGPGLMAALNALLGRGTRIGALIVSGEIAGVEPLLEGIERWLDPSVDATAAIVFDHAELARLPAHVEVYRAALALIAGDTEGTIAHANRALDFAEPSDHLPRGSAAALVVNRSRIAVWSRKLRIPSGCLGRPQKG